MDMIKVIEPKSDQLNADDLISGDRIIKIRDVQVKPTGEQRVSIFFDGDDNKPFKPCKTMCRVLVKGWGLDSKNYLGKYIKIYRDDKVKWAGQEVGGIRIRGMSHINNSFVTAITVTKGKRQAIEIEKLVVNEEAEQLKVTAITEANKGYDSFVKWGQSLTQEQKNSLGKEEIKRLTALSKKVTVEHDVIEDVDYEII